jgi:hypothetical protein
VGIFNVSVLGNGSLFTTLMLFANEKINVKKNAEMQINVLIGKLILVFITVCYS